MLSTLEILHYCRRFQGTLFAFCFERTEHFTEVLMDLRVLLAARIRHMVFCPEKDLDAILDNWNRAGEKFVVLSTHSSDLGTKEFRTRVAEILNQGEVPIVALRYFPADEIEKESVEKEVIRCAVELGARKIFFPGEFEGLEIDGVFKSYPTLQQIKTALGSKAEFNLPPQRVTFLSEQQEVHGVDIVIVQAKRGEIYEEVFTHAGSGTLLTQEYPNVLRPASESDVRDIMAIMQPYIAEGSLKAVSEEEVLRMIRSFMVYAVNEQIIAAAALINFGQYAELAKLCTLPRYQARGRARALVRALLDEARKVGKQGVFALTVHTHVGEFFERLGFVQVDRESLPESWRRQYDFSRPSKAYLHLLE